MIDVYLEVGPKKSFAMAVEWPGWGRWAKTPDGALEALASYHPRFAPIAARAGLELPPADFEVVAEIEGNATTDFGAPGKVPDLDRSPLAVDTARRQVALLAAAWESFDETVHTAPESLRKGPRGGGRDTSKIVAHVADAERGYVRTIGVKPTDESAIELRAAARDRITELVGATEPGAWPPTYFIRRSAWHVTDHLWEIEDRSES